MNEASRWRFALAEQIAAAYAQNPKTAAIMIAGSVGRGRADRYSDIEIDVYYMAAPTVAERIAAVEGAGAIVESLDEDEDEWEEQMLLGGVHAATSTFLVSTLERYLSEVVDQGQIAPSAQMRLHSLLNAQPVWGHELAEQWRAKARHYPDTLARAMLHENLLTPVGVAMNSGEGWAFPWVFPALVLVGVFGLISLPFLLHLPRRTMILFVVSGALFVGGAAGMELFAGVFGHLYQENGAIGRAVTHLEEFLEMAAIVVWIYALASYIETYAPLEIRFSMLQNTSPASSPEAQPTAADSQAAVLSGKASTTVGQ